VDATIRQMMVLCDSHQTKMTTNARFQAENCSTCQKHALWQAGPPRETARLVSEDDGAAAPGVFDLNPSGEKPDSFRLHGVAAEGTVADTAAGSAGAPAKVSGGGLYAGVKRVGADGTAHVQITEGDPRLLCG
jgi:hypothetical protein